MSGQEVSTFDPNADAAYFHVAPRISNGEAVEQHIVDRPQGEIILDFNCDGELLGIEILGARALLSQATIEGLRQLKP